MKQNYFFKAICYTKVDSNPWVNLSANLCFGSRCLILLFFTVLKSPDSLCQYAKGLTINNRANLVTNGAVQLVVNNAAFINNGTFKEGQSTVKLMGNVDTSQSYFAGNATYFYNLSSYNTSYGVVLKALAKVRNVLNVSAGKIYTDSNLTLISDSNLTARLDVVPGGCSIVGKANVERYFPGKRAWRLLTAPVTSSTTIYNSWQNNGVYTPGRGMYVTGPNASGVTGNGLDVSPQNNYSMMGFNYNTQSFNYVTNTLGAISKGSSGSADNTGYFTFVRGDRTYANYNYAGDVCNTTTLTSIGTLQIGTQTFSTSLDSGKYTLIGNPFASPIDFNNVTRNNLIKRIFVFDPSINQLGGWVMMDDLQNTGTFTKSVNTSNESQYIQSSQAFLVQTSGNVGSASLTINESSKCGNTINHLFRPAGQSSLESFRTILNLLNSDSSTTLADAVLNEFDTIYSNNYNLDDAGKISNTNENISLLRGSLNFTAERRNLISVGDTIFYKIWKTTQRSYQLAFQPQNIYQKNIQAVLLDSYLNNETSVDLTQASAFNFTIDGNIASAAQGRFMIVFRQASTLPVTITNLKVNQQNSSAIILWDVQNEINITKYELEKSTDGIRFTSIGTRIASATGNGSMNYSWTDNEITDGTFFYRIKIDEANGDIKYSNTEKLIVGKISESISVYPNPIEDNTIRIQFNNQPSGVYHLRILNNLGQQLYENNLSIKEGNDVESININSKLPGGVYQLEIIEPDKTQLVKKIFVK